MLSSPDSSSPSPDSRSPIVIPDSFGHIGGTNHYCDHGFQRSYDTLSDSLKLQSQDASFLLQNNGEAKKTIEKASGATLSFDDAQGCLKLEGGEVERARARDYVRVSLKQRCGEVQLSYWLDSHHKRNDLTVLEVPRKCVGFVSGKSGGNLRCVEAEWNTLMCFVKGGTGDSSSSSSSSGSGGGGRGKKRSGKTEKLAIFGSHRGRQGSELKIMSSIEHKIKGYYTLVEQGGGCLHCNLPNHMNAQFGTESLYIEEDSFGYILGKFGSTRRKLAAASGCIIEYVGRMACFAGTASERARGKKYVEWLIQQKEERVQIDLKKEKDVLRIVVPKKAMGFVTGIGGRALRSVESKTNTFCFANGDINASSNATEDLLVCSAVESARKEAERIILARINQHKGRNRHDARSRNGNNSDGYQQNRGRKRYDDRNELRNSRSPDWHRGRRRSRSPRSLPPRSRSPRSQERRRSNSSRSSNRHRGRRRSRSPRPRSPRSRSPRSRSPRSHERRRSNSSISSNGHGGRRRSRSLRPRSPRSRSFSRSRSRSRSYST